MGINPAKEAVSIHASAREATLGAIVHYADGYVSIHASAREATSQRSKWMVLNFWFQSTPPHGRRRAHRTVPVPGRRVSIHASAREATANIPFFFKGWGVSIHASAREATLAAWGTAAGKPVSIHASAREATRKILRRDRGHARFNPRLRTGGDCDRRWPARLKVLRA